MAHTHTRMRRAIDVEVGSEGSDSGNSPRLLTTYGAAERCNRGGSQRVTDTLELRHLDPDGWPPVRTIEQVEMASERLRASCEGRLLPWDTQSLAEYYRRRAAAQHDHAKRGYREYVKQCSSSWASEQRQCSESVHTAEMDVSTPSQTRHELVRKTKGGLRADEGSTQLRRVPKHSKGEHHCDNAHCPHCMPCDGGCGATRKTAGAGAVVAAPVPHRRLLRDGSLLRERSLGGGAGGDTSSLIHIPSHSPGAPTYHSRGSSPAAAAIQMSSEEFAMAEFMRKIELEAERVKTELALRRSGKV